MNFSYEAVRRIAGALRSEKDYAAKEQQIKSLDEALGGEWWHDIAQEESDGWARQVLDGFARRVAKVARCGFITADVADSLSAQPVYELVLFTRHPDGLWKMMEAMSLARKEWRQWLVDRREQARGGQAELRGLDWADDEAAWVAEIAANIEKLLLATPGFVLQNKLGSVLGRTLGLARVTHIRKALKKLHDQGTIDTEPKKDLQRFYIARA